MRRPSLLPFLLVVVLVAGICGPRTPATAGSAQEASPEAASEVSFPITPDPARCMVEPRAAESFAALLGTPVADGAPDGAERAVAPPVVEVPVGEWADEEVRDGIIATVVESSACFNAGDTGRAFALFTDAFVQGYVADNALTAGDIAMLTAAPEPVLAEVQETVLAVTDVSMLPDGRAGAFVVTASSWSGPDTSYTLFVQQGERWLLDEVTDFLAA